LLAGRRPAHKPVSARDPGSDVRYGSGENLESNGAYPFDLDATRGDHAFASPDLQHPVLRGRDDAPAGVASKVASARPLSRSPCAIS
jgi:hypothetical protein